MNALGAALAVRHTLIALQKGNKQASIVFYSNIAVRQGLSLQASLSMSKGAVEELAPNIRVTAIAPSIISGSTMSSKILRNIDAMTNIHALKILGTAKDIAKITVFLILDDSGWSTSQVIGVDGRRSVIQA